MRISRTVTAFTFAQAEDHHSEIRSGVSVRERNDDEAPKKQSFSAKGQTELSRKEREDDTCHKGYGWADKLHRQAEEGGGAATRGYQACRCAWKGVVMWHVTRSPLPRRSLACAAVSDPLYSDNPVIEGVRPTETRPG